MKAFRVVAALLFCLGVRGAELPRWAPFVEPNFPFYSSVLDARKNGLGPATNNLTPRGIVINVGSDIHVCFDVDLLRIAAIWRGPGVTPVSMAQGSYENENWGKKAPEGQGLLPRIVGETLLLNEIYAGVQIGERSLSDSRDASPDPTEVGRGPLPDGKGQFKAIDFRTNRVVLEYEIAGTTVRESFYISGTNTFQADGSVSHAALFHELEIGPHEQLLSFAVGLKGTNFYGENFAPAAKSHTHKSALFSAPDLHPAAWPKGKRWPPDVHTKVRGATTNDAYRIEHIALPLQNPWTRNMRLADIAFFSEGRAAALTFDGDIWLVDGLAGDLKDVRWRRFTSGLHEPLALAIKRDEIYVFDRNGIWKILDTDGNGEADRHELFCNRFTQTAETREFASSLKLAPDGSFVIGKPGQTGSTVGRDSGKILRISADGKEVTAIGHGFRQPFLGVNPRTGLVTASDQQGNYVPTTPLHIVRDDQYYGFRPVILPHEETTPAIAEPLVWIPHAINASGACQVWLGDDMGPLSNSLLHIGYYRPEIFRVLWNGGPNAAVVSFTRDLQFAPLSATVHPRDHSLFVAGFQLWGSVAPEISGLARITHIGGPSALPREVLPMREGVLLSFHVPVAESSVRPENFSAERWNYRRSHEYGSPHFKLDGSKGQETLFASSAYLSKDRRSIFFGVPDMRPVMQMRVGWSLVAENRMSLQQNAYLTPRALESFDPAAHGFAPLKIDLTARTNIAAADATPVTVEEGRRLAELMACAACHSADGSTLGKVGPTWKGLAGSRVRFADGTSATADADYLRESIREPNKKIVKDFDKSDAGMPSYEGVLTDPQIEALILYIQSLR